MIKKMYNFNHIVFDKVGINDIVAHQIIKYLRIEIDLIVIFE